MHHLTKIILVKSVIDTYENTGKMHLSHKYPTGIVEGGRENFACTVSAKDGSKRSDARLTPHLYQQRTHTPREETTVL